MPFRTKLDFSDNRQVKQHIETLTVLSGGTSFGVPFSLLPVGPNPDMSGITESYSMIVSTFSGNTGSTNYSWYDSRMMLGASSLSALTPSNSATTQTTGNIFTANTITIIDGNQVTLSYSGVSFGIDAIIMYDLGGGNYSGTVTTNSLNIISADTLNYTGRTIWVDVSGFTRTQDLIITKNPIVGYVWSCVDSEGKGEWQPVSGGSSGNTSYWSASTGTNAIVVNNSNSLASGNDSLAEGSQTTASGVASHAEGGGTLAQGNGAHAEGIYTSALGLASHAEGSGTTATGDATGAHAEGLGSKVGGDAGHAEGYFTSSFGDWGCHAEGSGTTATGAASHAEGVGSYGAGIASHAEGDRTVANGNNSHTEGSLTVAIGAGTHAEGLETTAFSDQAHAEGWQTTAFGNFSHTEGQQTIATGQAAHAEGAGPRAQGNFSHAEGNYTSALGQSSHSEGQSSTAVGLAAHAEGQSTIASGTSSHAEGLFTTAIGDASHAGGSLTVASGNTSFSFGRTNIVNGDYSAILGGTGNTITFDAKMSAIIAGSGITANQSNVVYVPDLIIDGLVNTDPLATDANGKIVAGTSDARLKTNIETLTNALEIIKNLRGVSFEYTKESNMGDGIRYGFIAQEVKDIVPNIVRERAKSDNMLSLNYTEIIPLLVEAIKEINTDSTKGGVYLETQTILAEDNDIQLNFSGNQQTAINGGVRVLHAMGQDQPAELITDLNGNWTTNNDFKPNALTIPKYTPTSSNDINGNEGNITRDDNYVYIKTKNGWKRTSLESF